VANPEKEPIEIEADSWDLREYADASKAAEFSIKCSRKITVQRWAHVVSLLQSDHQVGNRLRGFVHLAHPQALVGNVLLIAVPNEYTRDTFQSKLKEPLKRALHTAYGPEISEAFLVCTLSEAMMNGRWRSRMVYLAALALGTLLLYFGMLLAAPGAMDLYRCLLVVTLLSLVFVAIYAFRANLRNIFITIGLFLTAMLFVPTTDYIFNSILKEHQQNRILSFLGLVSDPLGTDYNVNQAKIAIGSGGWIGKGFLQGTQIKYGFVPEKQTDFIFCTIGEEWGFLGAMLLLTLFCLLIFRLMRMGERQEEPFGRIYCYCVAAFLLFHLLVNVGMTIGLMPVMGIPLPLVSYGGSSLMAFTIMLFIAVRLDASTRQYSFR
jgi:cell division protein FtsW (lipid II flippase)